MPGAVRRISCSSSFQLLAASPPYRQDDGDAKGDETIEEVVLRRDELAAIYVHYVNIFDKPNVPNQAFSL